jgi:BON domain-containing protein
MNDPRSVDTTPLNPPDVEPEDKARELAGDEPRIDQDGFLDTSQIDETGSIGHVETYEGELEAGVNDDLDINEQRLDESLELLETTELRAGETQNPDVAAEEGEVWVPPMDPPVVADGDAREGVRVAAGFGTSAFDEPFDPDHHGSALPDDDEVTERVKEALFADSRTSRLADQLAVASVGGVVAIRGVVDDVDDSDLIEEVVSEVDGVSEVRDLTDLAS